MNRVLFLGTNEQSQCARIVDVKNVKKLTVLTELAVNGGIATVYHAYYLVSTSALNKNYTNYQTNDLLWESAVEVQTLEAREENKEANLNQVSSQN